MTILDFQQSLAFIINLLAVSEQTTKTTHLGSRHIYVFLIADPDPQTRLSNLLSPSSPQQKLVLWLKIPLEGYRIGKTN